MSKAEKIERLCDLTHMVVSSAHSDLTDSFGYIQRLEDVATEGGFASAGTEEEIKLATCARYLRQMASEVEAIREKLLANSLSSSLLR